VKTGGKCSGHCLSTGQHPIDFKEICHEKTGVSGLSKPKNSVLPPLQGRRNELSVLSGLATRTAQSGYTTWTDTMAKLTSFSPFHITMAKPTRFYHGVMTLESEGNHF
jgi:hypothetical protein